MSQNTHKVIQVEQKKVSPLPKTKLVWVECTKKSPESTENNDQKIKKSKAKVLIESAEPVQKPQDVKKQDEKKVVNPRHSKSLIWVEKTQLVQNDETVKPISTPLDEKAMESLEFYEDNENETDGELAQLHKTSKRKKSRLPVYAIPKHVKDLIESDKVPKVLYRPLSPSTYTDYFAALLYAEDYYTEKWTGYLISNATLELHKEKVKKDRDNSDLSQKSPEEKKLFVKFEIDSIPERRPYLLSRDFVYLRHSGKRSRTFEGRFYRVMKSTHVLAEFTDDFYLQYSPSDRYDVSFSFNRACLKRAHQAVMSAMNPSFRHILFPNNSTQNMDDRNQAVMSAMNPSFCHILFPNNSTQNMDDRKSSLVHHIATMQGPLPYLISSELRTGRDIVRKAVLQIFRNSPGSRILICAPTNRTCDFLASSLKKEIPNSALFRANAAFRDMSDVELDVIPLCSYAGECFEIPSLPELEKFRVVTSTFVSSFRLHRCGLTTGHFTHIFMVDASGGTEPECMIALANLVGENTIIVITGCTQDYPRRVRSEIARRKNGLRTSYFHRLLGSDLYLNNDSSLAAYL